MMGHLVLLPPLQKSLEVASKFYPFEVFVVLPANGGFSIAHPSTRRGVVACPKGFSKSTAVGRALTNPRIEVNLRTLPRMSAR
jgi:hypothetical protein